MRIRGKDTDFKNFLWLLIFNELIEILKADVLFQSAFTTNSIPVNKEQVNKTISLLSYRVLL